MLNFSTETDINLALRTWHYPIINDSERYYQQRIIESSLMNNTLVCLPTGLGKTFIGLVVMYNFHRWFPNQKVLFMAPTRPLVNQQYRAWISQFSKQLNIDAIEITGSMGPEKRYHAWSTHNVFFTTPQVLENDIENKIIERDSIVCLVIDECHKAVGNYAYCSIVKMLNESGVFFRVCALSATPGSTVSAIQALLNSLRIEKIEYISESSEDIKPFSSQRTRQVITVPSDEHIEMIKIAIDEIIRKLYLTPLQNSGLNLSFDIDSINIASLPLNRYTGSIEGYLAGLRVLIHIRDLLIFYGINSMISYIRSFESGTSTPLKSRIKKQLQESETFQRILNDLQNMDASHRLISHPKLKILEQILQDHFRNYIHGSDTRAMVFSNYRESVLELCQYIQTISPQLKPAPLLGQSAQSDSNKLRKLNQQSTIDGFVQGSYNVLVTTCIGEEGLDIGFVDLIIFYDAHSSPIRLVQRSGRTGRQRDGKIVVLVNENKEKRMLENSETASKVIENAMCNSDRFFKFERIANNPTKIIQFPIQIVKFKLNSPSTKSESCTRKRNLSFVPRNFPSVAKLSVNNSLITKFGPHYSIAHSVVTQAMVNIFSQFSAKESAKTKCTSIWKTGLKSMPIFKIYNYQSNTLADYIYFYNLLNKDTPAISQHGEASLDVDLPDNFFDESDDFEIIADNFPSEMNSNLDSEKSSDQFVMDLGESELEEFDWSESEF